MKRVTKMKYKRKKFYKVDKNICKNKVINEFLESCMKSSTPEMKS